MKKLINYKTINKFEKGILTKCRRAIKGVDPTAEIILYGSRARGEATPESDYDLLILAEGKATLEREDFFRRQLFPIELETGAVLTVLLADRKAWNSALFGAMPLYQNIKKDGVIL